jgi:hypothetical protein
VILYFVERSAQSDGGEKEIYVRFLYTNPERKNEDLITNEASPLKLVIREDEEEKVSNVAQLRKYLWGRIGGDRNLLMWRGTFDSNTKRYKPENALPADKGITMKGHGEDGWISEAEALVIEISTFALHFRINGRNQPTNLQIEVSDPHLQLEELYEEIKVKYRRATEKELPPRTYAELSSAHGTWETNTYLLFNREDGISLSKEKPMEVTVPPERWHFKINGHVIAVDATDPEADLNSLCDALQNKLTVIDEALQLKDLEFENHEIDWSSQVIAIHHKGLGSKENQVVMAKNQTQSHDSASVLAKWWNASNKHSSPFPSLSQVETSGYVIWTRSGLELEEFGLSGTEIDEWIDCKDSPQKCFMKIIRSSNAESKLFRNVHRTYKRYEERKLWTTCNSLLGAKLVFEACQVAVITKWEDGREWGIDDANDENLRQQLLNALVVLFKAGITYVDVRSPNILVRDEKEPKSLYLIDYDDAVCHEEDVEGQECADMWYKTYCAYWTKLNSQQEDKFDPEKRLKEGLGIEYSEKSKVFLQCPGSE